MSEYELMTCARQPPDTEGYPDWFDGWKINEVLFCEAFRRDRPMLCVHDTFFTVEGRISGETMLKAGDFGAYQALCHVRGGAADGAPGASQACGY